MSEIHTGSDTLVQSTVVHMHLQMHVFEAEVMSVLCEARTSVWMWISLVQNMSVNA